MERFVQVIVGSGLVLIAGLWLATLASSVFLSGGGWGLAVIGGGGLGWGIGQKVER